MKLLPILLLLAACATAQQPAPTPAASPAAAAVAAPAAPAPAAAAPAPAPATSGPLEKESTLPYQMPVFDKLKESDYRPAFEAGMKQQLEEVAAIENNPAAATFENTIVALEKSGQLLNRVTVVFSNLTQSNTNPEHDAIDSEMSPRLASHQDKIFLDEKLFARVTALFDKRESLGLDAESLRLLERYHRQFVRAGAPLAEDGKVKLRKFNEQLSTLNTQFQQLLLKAANDGAIVVDSAAALDGLSAEQISAAAEAAKARKLDGKWVLPLKNTTGQDALAHLNDRALRERIFKASIARGNGGPDDTTKLAVTIFKLRADRAVLLGYPTHAAYALEDETAGTPAAVNKMLAQLAPAAEGQARKEAAEMQKLIDAQAKKEHQKPFQLAAWDWAFYAEQVRKARFDFDESQVKPYFELEHVLQDGIFYAAHELYGLTFMERKDLPVYEKSVRVFEVFDEGGKPLALFLADFFARDNKQGGAWMSEYVSQSRLLGRKPVVVNNLNVAKPPEGQPVLMTFDDVNGMFHEFGHALHGMFSNVNYPYFAGTSVPPDFGEYPSQFNEMWSRDPRVLARIARHYKTGEPMPKALLDKVLSASKFNEGFITSEYLAASIIDLAWHQLPADKIPKAGEVVAFENQVLKKAGMDFAAVPPRYHTTYFAHIFPGGYSAGYYAYIWSDVLAKDTEHWMKTHGGLQRANGDFFRAKVLSRGFSNDPSILFRDFYGSGPEVGPLLEARGLSLPKR
jgi:peptidyl-dipeptidase Dcp